MRCISGVDQRTKRLVMSLDQDDPDRHHVRYHARSCEGRPACNWTCSLTSTAGASIFLWWRFAARHSKNHLVSRHARRGLRANRAPSGHLRHFDCRGSKTSTTGSTNAARGGARDTAIPLKTHMPEIAGPAQQTLTTCIQQIEDRWASAGESLTPTLD